MDALSRKEQGKVREQVARALRELSTTRQVPIEGPSSRAKQKAPL